ncbi:uncharacterized protein LOC116012214 [Ipomoea triloba]|uniref:uncharacterized protein LOC116012214 n=1 Tax=Ipomoea triloba TaxID=35885 RepID=UPI00125D88A5|nr:uncharacterized protein LOC116012214 [Ipomoea triloba]
MALEAKVKPMFIFLMETKVRRDHAERLKNKLNFEGLFYVDGGGVGGGLALFWRDKDVAKLISYSKNHIDIQVRLPSSNAWRLTCFYGFPERNCRQQSWDLLRSLHSKSDLPWLVAGDFNDIAAQCEKRGLHSHPVALIEGFNNMLEDCGLFDLGMSGRKFTWERGKGTDSWVEERLDRAVAGADWCSLFPQATVSNHDVITSDHTAIFIEIDGPAIVRQKRRFMFENAWIKESGCKDIVLRAWTASVGEPLPRRLEHCGDSLKRWGGGFVKQTEKEIAWIQSRLNGLRYRRDEVSLRCFRDLDARMRTLYDELNIFWRQRAKQHWLAKGDRNTKFFHLYASIRRRKNRIVRLRDETGQWIDGGGLMGLAKRYFENIFTAKGVSLLDSLNTFVPKVSEVDNDVLMQPFTNDDVKEALFSMAPDKSPGPDGYSPAFFQHFWSEIGSDVSRFVLDCMNEGEFPVGMNDAIITLVPKIAAPASMRELRPIALCNVVYKILSKMLANRMKDVLEKIISASQSAFLPGRLITDNVLIASEVIHYLNRKREGRDGWCALKLDMAKAYDKMEWPFLNEIMCRMGFHPRWINLIMRCVSTVRYKVGVNGELSDFIVPSCGLRQGDPLSPYLFILCAEGLSHLLTEAVRNRAISLCVVARGAPGISHLFFADDSLLFFKATVPEAEAVKSCLVTYERLSGQSVNFSKSCIIFSRNTGEVQRDAVASVFNVSQAGNIGKYLGLPMGIGRNKKEVFSFIEAKLNHRLGGWHKKVLSRAGKEVLLKSVAQALPTYTMSIYYLPVTLCERIERSMNKFWWASNGNRGGGIRWMSWTRMCESKVNGGMGFKSLSRFNIALLAKQGWRLLTNPSSLAALLYKARYYPNGDFLDAMIGTNPSYCWRSILAGQNLLRNGCFKRIGNGKATLIWKHPWLPNDDDPFIHSPILQHDPNMPVSGLINQATKDWDMNVLNTIFEPRDVNLITKIPVTLQFDDQWCWRGDTRGLYSVRHGYRIMSELHNHNILHSATWRNLWKMKIPPNIQNFLWRCYHGVLPTMNFLWRCYHGVLPTMNALWRCYHGVLPTMNALSARHVEVDDLCPLCRLNPESLGHLFYGCMHVAPLWNDFIDYPLPGATADFMTWFSNLFVNGSLVMTWFSNLFVNGSLEVRLKFAALCWCIWHGRNDLVWNQTPWQPSKIKLVWNQTPWQPSKIKLEVIHLLNSWQELGERNISNNMHGFTLSNAASPTADVALIYVDAAVFPETDQASYGVIILDNNDGFVAAKSGPIRCLNDAHLAEAIAIKEALSWAKEKGIRRLKVYSDCQAVCNLFNGTLPDFSFAGCTINECRELKRHFEFVSIQFISRSVNKPAHVLARAARSQTGPHCWISSLPSCIQTLI